MLTTAERPSRIKLRSSKDVTPGDFSEYNKDPNASIYAVMRRDL